MTEVLFLGGPWHRQRRPVPGSLPPTFMVAESAEVSVDAIFADSPEPVAYMLRRQRGGSPVYVATDYPACDEQPRSVPGCGSHARLVFTATMGGRLAGKTWQPGDRIRLCPPHGADVYRAQHAVDREQLPEWLRPDARPSALVDFDQAQDTLSGTDFGRWDWRLPALRRETG